MHQPPKVYTDSQNETIVALSEFVELSPGLCLHWACYKLLILELLCKDEYEAGKCERLAALLERRRSFLEEGVEEEAINTYRELSLEYMRCGDCKLDHIWLNDQSV